jgi:hypothetical protein
MTKLFGILTAGLLLQATPFLTSTSFADGMGVEAAQSADRFHRHCVDRSKYEHCYWVESGTK